MISDNMVRKTPRFLSIDEILYLHRIEVARSGGTPAVRDLKELDASVGAPQATFGGVYLMNIFEMAATYIHSIAYHHPFLDGNKRTALLSALLFLYYNGYECDEYYEEELADQVLGMLSHEYRKEDIATFLSGRCHKRGENLRK